MLSSQIRGHRLGINHENMLPGVWDLPTCGTTLDPNAIFAELFVPQSIIYGFLALGRFEIQSFRVKTQEPSVGEGAVGKAVHDVAERKGHQMVNEVHVLIALLELFPDGFAEQLGVLRRARAKLPLDPRMVKALDGWRQAGKTREAERLTASLQTCGIDRSQLVMKFDAYLSSPFYPFGMEELRRYQLTEDRANEPRIPTLGDPNHAAFAAHAARDFRVTRS